MNRPKAKSLPRFAKMILVGTGLFTAMLAIILTIYIVRDGNFYLDYSISRYVGRELWSAIFFAVVNFVLVWLVWEYLKQLWPKYGQAWRVVMIIMLVGFVGLSLCPLGLFDANYGDYGVISILHQIFSRSMFFFMAIAAGIAGWKQKQNKWIFGLCLAYVICAITMMIMSFTAKIFWDFNFIFESVYIYLFYALLILLV
ncbi:hypothetical protein IK112_03060 [Candidatus Saccharibacteria bacterium]|nr:hypothetical protein [Candidatus Saccharibacteria bacterium]